MASLLRKLRKPKVEETPMAGPSMGTPLEPNKIATCSTKFSHGANVIIKKGNFKGYKGYVRNFYPSKYMVKIPIEDKLERLVEGKPAVQIIPRVAKIRLTAKQVKKVSIENEQRVQILNGKYASKKYFYEYEIIPSRIDILLTNNKIINEKTDDVFYEDVAIKIEDQVYDAQIIEIYENCTFDAFVKMGAHITRINNLNKNVIVKIYPEFKSMALAGTEADEADEREGEKESEELFLEIEGEREGLPEQMEGETEGLETEISGYEPGEETEGMAEIEETEEPETPEMKVSFKQLESMGLMETQLSKEEKFYKDEIAKVLKILNLPEDYINVYDLIKVIKETVKMFSLEKTITNTPDIKYIIACIVFNQIIKEGYRARWAPNFSLGIYTDKLISAKYLRDTDIKFLNQSILVKWKSFEKGTLLSEEEFKTINLRIQKLLNEKKLTEILKILMSNAWKLIKMILNTEVKEEPDKGKSIKDDLILVTRVKKKYEVARMLTLNDILSGNIPDEERRILWSLPATNIINLLKEDLLKLKETDLRQSADYDYIIKNIERAPYAIKDLQKQNKNTEYFMFVYNQLLDKLKILQEKTTLHKEMQRKAREQSKKEMEERREMALKRRRTAMEIDQEEPEEMEIEETYVPKHTKAYEKERKRREMKKLITKAARLKIGPEPTESSETEGSEPESEPEGSETEEGPYKSMLSEYIKKKKAKTETESSETESSETESSEETGDSDEEMTED